MSATQLKRDMPPKVKLRVRLRSKAVDRSPAN